MTNLPLQVKYWGIVPTPELKALVDTEAEKLRPYYDALAVCKLELGMWHLHRGEGHLFRVTIETLLEKPKDVLNTKFESPLGAGPDTVPGLLQRAFDAAARDVAARCAIG
jgi:hypothetical protein